MFFFSPLSYSSIEYARDATRTEEFLEFLWATFFHGEIGYGAGGWWVSVEHGRWGMDRDVCGHRGSIDFVETGG